MSTTLTPPPQAPPDHELPLADIDVEPRPPVGDDDHGQDDQHDQDDQGQGWLALVGLGAIVAGLAIALAMAFLLLRDERIAAPDAALAPSVTAPAN